MVGPAIFKALSVVTLMRSNPLASPSTSRSAPLLSVNPPTEMMPTLLPGATWPPLLTVTVPRMLPLPPSLPELLTVMPPLPALAVLLITSLPALTLMLEPSPSEWLVLTVSVPPPARVRLAPEATFRFSAAIGLLVPKLIAPSPLAARLLVELLTGPPVSTSVRVAALPASPLRLVLRMPERPPALRVAPALTFTSPEAGTTTRNRLPVPLSSGKT